MLFGCMPVGEKSYVWRDATLTGSDGAVREPSVTVGTLVDELRRVGFEIKCLMGFDDAYAWARGQSYGLCRRMKATRCGPDGGNVVFAASLHAQKEPDRPVGEQIARRNSEDGATTDVPKGERIAKNEGKG